VLNKEKIFKRLKQEGPQAWYHNFEIIKGSGIFCDPGKPPVINNSKATFEKCGIKEDFWKGLRVLDIGSYTGARSFYLEDCGAKVTALDIQPPELNGFKLIHEIRQSKVEFIFSSVYDLSPAKFGRFDVVLFFAVFYHLKHPLLALERINSICKTDGFLLGGGTTSDRWFHDDNLSCEKGVDFERITKNMINDNRIMAVDNLNKLSLCGFAGSHYYRDKTNWFIPNTECLKEWLRVSGFDFERVNYAVSEIQRDWNKSRTLKSSIIFKAKRISDPIPEYKQNAYQSYSRADQELYLKKYRIPTEHEVESIIEENKKLKDEIKRLRTCLKSQCA